LENDDQTPSVNGLKVLLCHIRGVLQICEMVPPTLQSAFDKGWLLSAVRSFESIRKEGAIRADGWPAPVGSALIHIWELSQRLVARWGLTPIAELPLNAQGFLELGLIPESPLTLEDAEIQLLKNIDEKIAGILSQLRPRQGNRPTLQVISDPDRAMPDIPPDAVACSQNQVAQAIGQTPRTGLVKYLRAQQFFRYAERYAGRWHVVFRDSQLQEKLKAIVKQQSERRHRNRKKPPRGRG
jgi:hypothetical protein